MNRIKIAPSILSADFSKIGDEIVRIDRAGADLIHCDVMDGVFVPNITFGIKMVNDIRPHTRLPLDVHLMIVNPINYIEKFIKAGADIITFHIEAEKESERALKLTKELGVKCGLVVSPDTEIEQLFPFLEMCDMVLVMSVYPGFGGQKFMTNSLEKLKKLKKRIDLIGKDIDIEIDGGINIENSESVKAAGANIIVAGNAIFGSAEPEKVIRELRGNF